MEKGVINLSVVSVRKEPSHTAEIVNQLLFGDTFEIIETYYNWLNVKADYDGYGGWVQESQCLGVDDAEYNEIISNNQSVTTDVFSYVTALRSDIRFPLVAGSTIALYDNKIIRLGKEEYQFHGNYCQPFPGNKHLTGNAMMYINAPYLWGGRSFLGIDCSGLTQMAYKLSGIKILRDASQQAEQGTTIDFISQAKHGDLMFFDNEEGKIIHTGMYIGLNKIIHASGKVRIDLIDHQGIFNTELNHYTHVLRIIKRMV